jgi:hypothetical protein
MSQTNEDGDAEIAAPAPIPAVKIVPDIPAIFADGAISQNWGPGISKFYLGRLDADPAAQKDGTSVPVAQIIMPAEGFVHMVAFFEHRLKTMVERGVVSQDLIDKAREHWINTEK